MLGVVAVVLTCLAMLIITWRTGIAGCNGAEAAFIQKCLRGQCLDARAESSGSRPAQLIGELALTRGNSALVVNLLNEVLSEVDRETRGAQRVSRACARVSVTAGMAGACIEVAVHAQNSMARGAGLAAAAVVAGFAGAVSCAVIGQWAMRAAVVRRRLWDEFVHWILNSEFLQSAWSVRASGLRPTNDLRNGQDT